MVASSTYLVAIGSNRCGIHGRPRDEVRAAISQLEGVVTCSAIVESAPLGPSIRRFANAGVAIETSDAPPVLLARLKALERAFGRRRGRRWGARVLDLDIVLWSRGCWGEAGLVVPHVAFRERRFVLAPLADIAPGWRDPVTGRTLRQLAGRLAKVDRMACRP